jgi:hypothetical protein
MITTFKTTSSAFALEETKVEAGRFFIFSTRSTSS